MTGFYLLCSNGFGASLFFPELYSMIGFYLLCSNGFGASFRVSKSWRFIHLPKFLGRKI